jgi:predicted RNA methylase
MAATKKIPEDALNIIASMDVEQHGVVGDYHIARITDGQLPRDLYVAVDKVLKAMGGKWNRAHKGHVFDGDPSDAIDQAVLTGSYTDKKQALQFFETPEALAEELVAAAYILNTHRVLEPSAGRGRIVRAVLTKTPSAIVYAVEIDGSKRADIIRSSVHDKYVFIGDFMQKDYDSIFDRCVMNPPFSRRQDVDHVTRAFSMLRPGGRLVSVVSGSAMHRIDEKGEAFKALVKRCGSSYDLPDGTFKESGTCVRASVVILNKE